MNLNYVQIGGNSGGTNLRLRRIDENPNAQIRTGDCDFGRRFRRDVTRTARVEIESKRVCARIQRCFGILLRGDATDFDDEISHCVNARNASTGCAAFISDSPTKKA